MNEKHTEFLFIQLGQLNDAISAEFDLVTARMGWLVTAEAFIFSGFSDTVSAYSKELFLLETMNFLLIALPILGILLSVIVYIALLAAHSATTRLKNQRDSLIKNLPEEYRFSLISSTCKEHKLGDLPPRLVPPIIISIWLFLLLSVSQQMILK